MARTGIAPRNASHAGGRQASRRLTSLRWSFVLYLSVALGVLLAGFSLVSIQSIRQARQQAFAHQMRLTTSFVASLLGELGEISLDAPAYVPDMPTAETTPDALDRLFSHLVDLQHESYLGVNGVRLVDSEGQVHARFPIDLPSAPETLPDFDVIQKALSVGNTVIGSSRLPAQTGVPFAAVVVPLPDASGAPGAAALVVDTVGLGGVELFSANRPAEFDQDTVHSHEVEVFDGAGRVLTTTKGADQLGQVSYLYALMQQFIEQRSAGTIVYRPTEGEQAAHIAAIMPVDGTPFFLATEEPLGTLLDWPQQLRNQALLLGGTAALVILAVGWVVAQQLVQPLIVLRAVMARIKGGDLATPVRVRGRGEMAELAVEIEEMRSRLQTTVSNLDAQNADLRNQVQRRTRQLHNVVGKLIQAQEDERRRLARELHDETAQSLTALGIFLDDAAMESENRGESTATGIRDARQQVHRLVAETRRLVFALRPSVLDDGGLIPALRWCADAYLRPSGVEFDLRAPEPELRCAESTELTLFRVGQEAMSNIAHHAEASQAIVSVTRHGNWVTLTVEDDGIGFEPQEASTGDAETVLTGIGLAGMKERINLVGGRLTVSSRLGHGTIIEACAPADGMREETP